MEETRPITMPNLLMTAVLPLMELPVLLRAMDKDLMRGQNGPMASCGRNHHTRPCQARSCQASCASQRNKKIDLMERAMQSTYTLQHPPSRVTEKTSQHV
ncbi:hypothetical protein BRADI_3g27795v3 [Brachypodium distachyon]|uniref:Uncharacterized protein n=1 Tax=Brachypodium distachyon TaxID=15368 RepID=A0A2K2CZM5_BRADI|nr:hypothetical protein BRADI_3g27795v3 [Brachypodium distachyon]PNT67475.1 hypothetical protein BRADI_3g27795v3 [Brachypodium distachyon]